MASKLIMWLLISFQINTCAFSQESERAILEGKLARIGQFPYVVFLRNAPISTNRGGWLCTGAILAELWVVTGAHCYSGYPKKNISIADVRTYIKAGIIDRSSPTSATQERESVRHVLMKPNKSKRFSRAFNNDIALIKVNEPFVFNKYVDSITIAKRSLPVGRILTCTLVGFGLTNNSTDPKAGLMNTKLYYTSGTLDGDKFSCRKRMKKMGRTDSKYWGEEHLCVDPSKYTSSPCNGDSGGPIVCDGLHAGTDVARMNIFGAKKTPCGAKGNFHIYMFLGYYEAWLRKHIPDLPPSRRVSAGPRSKKRATSGGGDTRFRMADIGLVVLVDFVLRRGILQSQTRV